jgi:hypothetical protein
MAKLPSALDPDALATARGLLMRRERPQKLWPVLGAAGMLAVSALLFAAAMVTAPPLTSEHLIARSME